MAPTEILARQHFATIAPLADKAGLKPALLTGREKGASAPAGPGRPRRMARSTFVIGTHALFQDAVAYTQPRRSPSSTSSTASACTSGWLLTAKGDAPDMLVMTATPIPRTLVLSAFGDMDVSRLTRKSPPGAEADPPRGTLLGRAALTNWSRAVGKRGATTARRPTGSARSCRNPKRSSSMSAARTGLRGAARGHSGRKVGLVHGRMKAAEKDEAMRRLQGRRKTKVLDRHHRGGGGRRRAGRHGHRHRACRALRSGAAAPAARAGRTRRASCLDLPAALRGSARPDGQAPPVGACARPRTASCIAEEDLKLRGEGELLGTRQSGIADWFQVARLEIARRSPGDRPQRRCAAAARARSAPRLAAR
jgi:ATP-dependent DNA helicase RecG